MFKIENAITCLRLVFARYLFILLVLRESFFLLYKFCPNFPSFVTKVNLKVPRNKRKDRFLKSDLYSSPSLLDYQRVGIEVIKFTIAIRFYLVEDMWLVLSDL